MQKTYAGRQPHRSSNERDGQKATGKNAFHYRKSLIGGRSSWSGLFYRGHKSEPNQVYRESKRGDAVVRSNFPHLRCVKEPYA
jgi:hypothetical protein